MNETNRENFNHIILREKYTYTNIKYNIKNKKMYIVFYLFISITDYQTIHFSLQYP